MIKFIRENSKLITKFMMTHLVMSILGIMVGLAVLTLEDRGYVHRRLLMLYALR